MNKDIANDGSEIVAIGDPNSKAREESKRRWKVSWFEWVTDNCGCCSDRRRVFDVFQSEDEAKAEVKYREENNNEDITIEEIILPLRAQF